MALRLTVQGIKETRMLLKRLLDSLAGQQQGQRKIHTEPIERYFDDLVRHVEKDLRRLSPVRTGLLRRRVENRGRGAIAVIFSNAENSAGVEYAQFVRRYDRAIRITIASARIRVKNKRFFIKERSGFFGSRTGIVEARRVISIDRRGTAIVITRSLVI